MKQNDYIDNTTKLQTLLFTDTNELGIVDANMVYEERCDVHDQTY